MHFQYRFLDCKAQLKAYALFVINGRMFVTGTTVNILRRNTMAAKSGTTAPSDRKLYHL